MLHMRLKIVISDTPVTHLPSCNELQSHPTEPHSTSKYANLANRRQSRRRYRNSLNGRSQAGEIIAIPSGVSVRGMWEGWWDLENLQASFSACKAIRLILCLDRVPEHPPTEWHLLWIHS